MSDPWQIAVEIVRVWLPFLSALTIVWKVYKGAKDAVTAWANTLLDNHLNHVQQSLDSLCILQKEQNDWLKTIAEK